MAVAIISNNNTADNKEKLLITQSQLIWGDISAKINIVQEWL